MIEKRWDLLTKKWVPLEPKTQEAYLAHRFESEGERIGQGNQILDNISSGIIAVDSNGKVTLFNKRAEQIIRVKADELMGKELESIPTVLASLLLETLKTGKTYHRKEVHILPQNILVGVSTSQFYNFRGEVIGAVMVFADLSKVKEAEHNLMRKNEDEFWKRLSHCLAHEIKNPLVSISTFTQLLTRNYNDPHFRKNFINTVSNDIGRLNNLVEKLITMALSLELNLEIQDIEKALSETLTSLRQTNYPQTILVNCQTSKLPLISFDFNKIKEALRNILINAIEAMPKGGSLTISTHSVSEDFVEMRFQDTGEGIASEDMPQLFLPFFTTKNNHSGLGLTLSKKIIEAHGGFIHVKSQIGTGATFSVLLPIHAQEKNIKEGIEGKRKDSLNLSRLSSKNIPKRRKK